MGVTPQLAKLLLIDTLINLFDKLIDWLVLPNKLNWVKKKNIKLATLYACCLF